MTSSGERCPAKIAEKKSSAQTFSMFKMNWSLNLARCIDAKNPQNPQIQWKTRAMGLSQTDQSVFRHFQLNLSNRN